MTKIRKKFIGIINKNESSGINLAILSIIALFIKQYCTHLTYKNLSIYGFKYYLNSFCTDLIVILIILCLTTINHFIKIRRIRIINNIISFLIFIIFCIDIFTIFFLQNRVAIPETFQYVSNGGNGFTNIALSIIIIIVILRIILLLLTTRIKKNSKITKNILLSILLVLGGISISFSTPKEINNIISLNINYLNDRYLSQKLYSSGGVDKLQENNNEVKKYQDYIKYIKGEGKDLNIILVFAESISAIDSANVGGNDKMPKFDQIQKDGITFTNFITNGTTSDTAHISTFLGIIPLFNIRKNNTPYSGYKSEMLALPEFLNGQGYKTTFISSASLSFLKQRDFLSSVGFQTIIGEEEFKDKKKYTFDAAPDGDLYDRALQEIQNQTGKYFIGLQTISFHKPYDTPSGKTEDTALQYSDEELYNFYLRLQEIGFFDNGILIIMGDHRKMNAAEENEVEKFGKNRYTRSVATIVGSGIKKGTVNTGIIQHTDFYNSIKKLVGHGLVDLDTTYNDVFTRNRNRDRAITNSEVYENNRYTITYSGEIKLFKNLSNLPKDNPVYKYFSSYLLFEFGNDNELTTSGTSTKFIGHRGAINNAPENTLESFLMAKKLGADGIEFDVSYTKDKENIVAHGDLLYTSNCNKLKVGSYSYDWTSRNCTIVNGEKYRTLKEMLELVDGLFDYYFLEIKVYDESLGIEQTLDAIQTVKELNMQDRVIFISYSDSARKLLKSYSDIIYGRDTFDINDLDFIGENNSKYFLAPFELMTQEIVNKAKELGKQVVTYTVNNTGDYQKMKDLGINIILTDKIQLLNDYEENK